MKKYFNIIFCISVLLVAIGYSYFSEVNATPEINTNLPVKQMQVKTTVPKTVVVNSVPVKSGLVSTLTIVSNPSLYLNKEVTFEADFVGFSALGLNYKPAYRNSEDYIGFLIKRDDVTTHIVPLSEMKIFIKRKDAEKFLDLEQNDKIRVTGKVFSIALGDPWVDVITLTVVSKAKKN